MYVIELESGIVCKRHTDQLLKLNIEKSEEVDKGIIVDETKLTETSEVTDQVEVRNSKRIKKPTIKLNL